jgi:type III pantothenate kinase
MNLLIGDVGNTVTKLSIVDEKKFKIKKIIYFPSTEIQSKNKLKKNLEKALKNVEINSVALFSIVVPRYRSILKNFLNRRYKIMLKELKDKNIDKIIKIKVKNKNEVGSDRLANAVGAYKKYRTNCIILDFGTATTFDVVTKNGFYNGGLITPGINLSIKSLARFADQLPIFLMKKPKKIVGKNTVEALRSGFYWGYSGLINNIILKITKKTKKNYKIIFTGGYASLFKSSIVTPFTVDKNITIEGITEIYKKNFNNLIK